jgi:hypothetical protein
MSGPDPARLDELRQRFETAAYDAPNVAVLVIYRPPLRLESPDGHVIDPADNFLRGFLGGDGDLAPGIRCSVVSTPPYRPRVTHPSSGRLDWEGIVRQSSEEDPRSERPHWWCHSIFREDVQFQRLDLLAADAARLVLGRTGPPGTLGNEWMIHLAGCAAEFVPSSRRDVLLSESHAPQSAGPSYRADVRFAECPPQLRRSVTRHPAPSWWLAQFNNVFRVSRDVIDEARQNLNPDAPAGGTANRPSQSDEITDWSLPQTIQQLAKVFGFGRNAMSKRLNSGEVKARKVGQLWMVSLADVPLAYREKLSNPEGSK